MNTATGEARVRDRAASERRIRTAAVTLFARHGFDHVTVRMIASEAGVNVALINRYFGSKLNLFTAVLAAESRVPDLTGIAPADLPGHLAAHATRPRGERPMLRALNRSQGAPEVDGLLKARLEELYVGPIAAKLTGADSRHRARAAVAILLGASTARGVYDVHDLPDPALAHHLTAALTAVLFL